MTYRAVTYSSLGINAGGISIPESVRRIAAIIDNIEIPCITHSHRGVSYLLALGFNECRDAATCNGDDRALMRDFDDYIYHLCTINEIAGSSLAASFNNLLRAIDKALGNGDVSVIRCICNAHTEHMMQWHINSVKVDRYINESLYHLLIFAKETLRIDLVITKDMKIAMPLTESQRKVMKVICRNPCKMDILTLQPMFACCYVATLYGVGRGAITQVLEYLDYACSNGRREGAILLVILFIIYAPLKVPANSTVLTIDEIAKWFINGHSAIPNIRDGITELRHHAANFRGFPIYEVLSRPFTEKMYSSSPEVVAAEIKRVALMCGMPMTTAFVDAHIMTDA